MLRLFRGAGAVACVAVLGILAAGSASAGVRPLSAKHEGRPEHRVKHVLLISVDGMHQSDLDWYVANHPNSELAKLVHGGTEFSNAHTSDPSDSDPGGTALMTGGDPRATGVYYDVEYSHKVFPPGTTDCSGPAPGGNVIYDSPDDTLNAVPDLLNNGFPIKREPNRRERAAIGFLPPMARPEGVVERYNRFNGDLPGNCHI